MECDRVFVSACMDILSEQSQGGRTGLEAQLSSSCESLARLPALVAIPSAFIRLPY